MTITLAMASYGATLADPDLAQKIRESVQLHMSRGSSVVLDFTGVSASNHFIVELLGGLEKWFDPSPFQLVSLSVVGANGPVSRKIKMVLEAAQETAQPN